MRLKYLQAIIMLVCHERILSAAKATPKKAVLFLHKQTEISSEHRLSFQRPEMCARQGRVARN
jgi:hypothetical protein